VNQAHLWNGMLPPELIDNLQGENPQWTGSAPRPFPKFHRSIYPRVFRLLTSEGLSPAVAVRGPRRVGKTVLLRQVMQGLREAGVPPERMLYVAFDDLPSFAKLKEPVLAVSRWFEQHILKRSFNEAWERREPAYLLFDEIQNLPDWAVQLKHLVDIHAVRVLLTGSSSLRIEAGRDSIAGRVTTITMGPLALREISGIRTGNSSQAYWGDDANGQLGQREFWQGAVAHSSKEREARREAFRAFSERGGYPFAHEAKDTSWSDLSAFLNETVISRALQHDLRVGERGRKRDERLLEEVFRLACRYAGQTPGQSAFVPELQRVLNANIGYNRVQQYLRFLDATLLLRLVEPLELRLKKRKAPPKICICDHALRAAWLQEIVPLAPEALTEDVHLSILAGRLAESTLGYFLVTTPGVELAYLPERDGNPEVDFILTCGTKRIPIEVKYRRKIDYEDARGLIAFMEKSANNAPFGLLVTLEDDVTVVDPRIIPLSLSSLMWLR
jgi:predicted AAA+ superfamily ATPase